MSSKFTGKKMARGNRNCGHVKQGLCLVCGQVEQEYWREQHALERVKAFISQKTTSRWVVCKGELVYSDKFGCKPRKVGKMGLNTFTSDMPWGM